MSDKWNDILEHLKDFGNFYWKSKNANRISLIDDLRLSKNIHETAHSRILYKLLCVCVQESYLFLKLFMETVGCADILDKGKIEIKIEYEHIDVLIIVGNKAIIIENKVNHACDQDRQLERYMSISELNGKDIYILYLVRSNMDVGPSDDSLPTVKLACLEKRGRFKKISYEEHILRWLKRCEEVKNENDELLKAALIQYRDYLENLLKKCDIMDKDDAKIFELDVLKLPNAQPVEIVNKVIQIKDKVDSFKQAIREYEGSLSGEYLEYFKDKTGINDAKLNSFNQIEFPVNVSGTQLLFIYDFLMHDAFVWFGTKYPLTKFDGSSIDLSIVKKVEGEMVTKIGNVDKSDNYRSCEEQDFKYFYRDKKWFCKYCKDNESAISEIIDFKNSLKS